MPLFSLLSLGHPDSVSPSSRDEKDLSGPPVSEHGSGGAKVGMLELTGMVKLPRLSIEEARNRAERATRFLAAVFRIDAV